MSKDPRFPTTPLNGCSACLQDFANTKLFDKHRVGTFDPYERGCMTVKQMEANGWERDERGRWHDPKLTEQTREYFAAKT